MSSWTEQLALVTGGTRGIGRAIAKRLAQLGARVVVTSTGRQETTPPYAADHVAIDFSTRDKVAEFARYVEKMDGLSILINNAGINLIHKLEEFPPDDFDRIHSVNVRTPFLIMQSAARNMIKSGTHGRILNIGSIWATHTRAGRSGYCTSKAAIAGMTRAAATDLARHGILVNCLSPGFIQTELTEKTLGPKGIEEMEALVPLNRLGRPEEIAKVASFLVGPDNTYMTGQNIIVDGGFTNV